MLVNIKPLGWAFGELLTSAQMNSISSQLPNAVDGIGGGTYAATAPISITGQLITFDDLTVTDDLTVSGDTILGNADTDTLTVNAEATFAGPVTLGSGLSDAITVNGAAGFSGLASFADDVFFEGDVALGNGAADAITLSGVLTQSGSGRILETAIVLPNSDTSVDITQFRQMVSESSVTATRQITTTASVGPATGDWFSILNVSGFSQTLVGLLAQSVPNNTWAKYQYVSAAWHLIAWSAA